MRKDIFSHILNKSIKSFNEENSSKYISILNTDLNMIEQDGICNIFNLIKHFTSFILAVISIIYISIPITIAVFIMSSITFIIPQFFSKKLSARRKEYSNSSEIFITKTNDLLSGFELIKTFNLFNKVTDNYEKSSRNLENKKFNFRCFNTIINALTDNLGSLIFCVPIILGGYYVVIDKMSVGTMIALFQLMGNIVTPLTVGVQSINSLKSLKDVFKKIEILTESEPTESSKLLLSSFTSSIDFNKVSFYYNKANYVLKDITLKFEKGKKYVIIGESGSGKSTLLKLLLRYYDNYSGNIYIDKNEIKLFDINSLYNNISIIHQNVFMFDDTLKNNITLYKEYDDQEIINILHAIGLASLINSLPNGLYEYIGDNGLKLSGGEKQRIAIARALVRHSDIVILDESTSALDNETTFNIEQSILDLKDITVISVTHKLIKNILISYDEIIVLKNGQVVEQGSFESLINNKNYFYSLYNIANYSV